MLLAVGVLVLVLGAVAAVLARLARRQRDLAGQVVLLTGAGGAFGRPLALALARRGCLLACSDVARGPNEETVALVLKQQKEAGQQPGAVAYPADLTKSGDIADLVQRVVKDFGRIDILISNAGQLQGGAVWEMSEEEADLVLDVNLRATLLLVRAAMPHMRARRAGHIVAISSSSAVLCTKKFSVYAATKAGLSHYMECLYHDLHDAGLHNDIHVTTIEPFLIKSYHALDHTVIFTGWLGRNVLSYLNMEKSVEEAVCGIAARCHFVTIPGRMGLLLLLHRMLPFRLQAFAERALFPTEVRPLISYHQFRHREAEPDYLREALSKGYPPPDDLAAVCQRLADERTAQSQQGAQGGPLPHEDLAAYADSVAAFYRARNESAPPAVQAVFGLSGQP